MRSRAVALFVLLLATSLTPFVSSDVTITAADATWDGQNHVLDGNVTVSSTSTLTIEPGAVIDTGDYWIQIDGTLIATDVEFMSSITPSSQGSTGAGLWPGIIISSTAEAVLTNVTIRGAESALAVHGDVTIHEEILITNSYIGLDIHPTGTVVAENVTMETIDIQAVHNEGQFTVTTGEFTNAATGIYSSNQLTASDVTFNETGFALDIVAGDATIVGLGLDNVSVGIGSDAGASTTVSSIFGQYVALFIDGSGTDDLTVSDALLTGDRFLWGSVESIYVSEVDFTQQALDRTVIDIRCTIDCMFDDVTLSQTEIGFDIDGPGITEIKNSNIESTNTALRGSGDGLLIIEESNFTSQGKVMTFSGLDTEITDTNAELSQGDGPAVKVLEGHHEWNEFNVEKAYSSADVTSQGIDAWYTSIQSTTLTTNGFSTGALFEDSTLTAETATFINGKVTGLYGIQSTFTFEDLTTSTQQYGVRLGDESHLQTSIWAANLHNTPLLLEGESTANARKFTPQNTAQGSSDAVGDGTFLYGGPITSTISTTEYGYLYETYVSFTDINNQPIQAEAYAHHFLSTGDTNGVASLPLLSTGSMVDVLYQGAGVRAELVGNQAGQSVQIITVPQGDWNLPSSSTVVLGAKPDGSPHMLNGNLNFATNSQLKLIDTTLIVDSSSSVDMGASGTLSGDGGILNATSLSLNVQSTFTSEGNGLEIQSPVQWSCSSPQSISNVRFTSTLSIGALCDVEMIGGEANEQITVGSGGSFSLSSTLEINVLDKGVPVEGATIIVDGQTVSTNALGEAIAQTTARSVDSQGDVQSGIKTVTMQIQSFTEFFAWDTKRSTSHTFMASTVPTGTINSWLVLEKSWSPYRLEGDLTIASTTKLTVNDGVELRIASQAVIDVQGVFEAGSATISSTGFGARWGGLLLDGIVGSRIQLSGTQLVEGSPLLTVSGYGEMVAENVNFARSAGADPLISISSGAQGIVSISNSHLRDAGSMCIQSQSPDAKIVLDGVEFTDCNGDAAWIRLSDVAFNNVTINEGMDDGLALIGVTGHVSNLKTSSFVGDSTVRLESIDGDFIIEDSQISVGSEVGLIAFNCDDIIIRNLEIAGAPGLDIDETSGQLEQIYAHGNGIGTGVTIRHGQASSMMVSDLSITNYSVGLRLHAHDFEEPGVAYFHNLSIDSSDALSIEYYDAQISDSDLVGSISVAGSTINMIDSSIVGTKSISADGILSEWSTHSLSAMLNGFFVEATYVISTELLDQPSTYSGQFVDVILQYSKHTETQSESSTNAMIETYSEMSLVNNSEFELGNNLNQQVTIVLSPNAAPIATVNAPYSGQRFMETTPIEVRYIVSDDTTELSDIVMSWKVFDAQGQLVTEGALSDTGSAFNVTNLGPGLYVLQVIATDDLNLFSTTEVDFEVTLLDTDGDWISSCNSDTWFDASNGVQCGPDIYDPDDDNDGRLDDNDVWPIDACAWMDTDDDGQPDRIECPEGQTTMLFEDQDDDGDGTPDELEGKSSTKNEDQSTGLLLIGGIVVIVLIIFFVRTRGGGPKSLGEIDERML
ncbi:MAG: hypothetical protein L7U53_04755 [Candidatus Poseidoniaceae archaeon]|nr:hypothetical protein [Candidatus Poseidoniaceae archaeon]